MMNPRKATIMADWLPVILIALALVGLCLGTLWRLDVMERRNERNHQRRLHEFALAKEAAIEEVRQQMRR